MWFNSKKRIAEFLQQTKEQPLAVLYELRINYSYDLGLKTYIYPFSRCHLVVFKDHMVVFRYNRIPLPIAYRPEVFTYNVAAFEKMYMNFTVLQLKHIRFEYIRKTRANITLTEPYNTRITIRYAFKNLSQENIGLFKHFSG